MSAVVLDGRAVAATMRAELADAAGALAAQGRPAALAVVQVAGDPASARYLRAIEKTCETTGIGYAGHVLPADATQEQLEALLVRLSANSSVNGILLHVPLPAGFDADAAVLRIDPRKDVDGVHPVNVGLLAAGRGGMVPNTPAGGMELLRRYGIDVAGRRAVVVGRSAIVGRPMALLLLHAHATVTIAHSRTRDLAGLVRDAEIIVAATGRARIITAEMVRPGAVVVDFGMNSGPDGALVGDVDAAVAAVAGYLTPVPGGTGPMTTMLLLANVLRAARTTT